MEDSTPQRGDSPVDQSARLAALEASVKEMQAELAQLRPITAHVVQYMTASDTFMANTRETATVTASNIATLQDSVSGLQEWQASLAACIEHSAVQVVQSATMSPVVDTAAGGVMRSGGELQLDFDGAGVSQSAQVATNPSAPTEAQMKSARLVVQNAIFKTYDVADGDPSLLPDHPQDGEIWRMFNDPVTSTTERCTRFALDESAWSNKNMSQIDSLVTCIHSNKSAAAWGVRDSDFHKAKDLSAETLKTVVVSCFEQLKAKCNRNQHNSAQPPDSAFAQKAMSTSNQRSDQQPSRPKRASTSSRKPPTRSLDFDDSDGDCDGEESNGEDYGDEGAGDDDFVFRGRA